MYGYVSVHSVTNGLAPQNLDLSQLLHSGPRRSIPRLPERLSRVLPNFQRRARESAREIRLRAGSVSAAKPGVAREEGGAAVVRGVGTARHSAGGNAGASEGSVRAPTRSPSDAALDPRARECPWPSIGWERRRPPPPEAAVYVLRGAPHDGARRVLARRLNTPRARRLSSRASRRAR